MNQMRDIDKINQADKEAGFIDSFNKAVAGMLVPSHSASGNASSEGDGPKKPLLLPNGKYCKSCYVLDYIALVLLTAEMQLHSIMLEAKVAPDEPARK